MPISPQIPQYIYTVILNITQLEKKKTIISYFQTINDTLMIAFSNYQRQLSILFQISF